MTLSLRETDPFAPEALALIAGSEAELAAIYPPEARFAFSPQELVEAGVRFLVAWRGGAAVGCGGVAPCAGYGELKRMYAAPAARGTGVAPALLAGLEEIARGLGLPLMRLETGTDSHAAIGLYTRSGYRPCPAFGTYTDNGSSVFMEKSLR
ncbi:GNAT family N-acetyltransferase [Paroceanicella profunda]|uniref:GNAT family N-acetyltransferase n=1 Tax=Paroceanicella profunda TaxID=2579971 RepID=A0A5B8FXB0_9RHOB|nr:GNAT family N-acetyltransferase [Paroceanicella profunda]QDL91149.1 GNAT family N-acetyltransferase [Paroceanicella profunda]